MTDIDAEKENVKLSPLELAAQAWGIEPAFYDIWGKPHNTTPEVNQTILHSLGVDQVEAALEQRRWSDWSRPLPETIVRGSQSAIVLSLPESGANEKGELVFVWEDGSQAKHPFDLSSLPVTEQISLRGQNFVRKEIALPPDAPHGYHTLKFNQSEARL